VAGSEWSQIREFCDADLPNITIEHLEIEAQNIDSGSEDESENMEQEALVNSKKHDEMRQGRKRRNRSEVSPTGDNPSKRRRSPIGSDGGKGGRYFESKHFPVVPTLYYDWEEGRSGVSVQKSEQSETSTLWLQSSVPGAHNPTLSDRGSASPSMEEDE
jgi:hypothetical protein